MYPMKAVVELTGLTPETLRAWERRYGAVRPTRDAQGRRLYDSAAIQRLSRLHSLTDRGHAISKLAVLDDDALDRLLDTGRQAAYGGVDALPSRMLDAIADYRIDVFDRDLAVAITTLPMRVLVSRVVMPLLQETGARWADGRFAIAQERLVSSLLRTRLLAVLSLAARDGRPPVLFATLPGEGHELGLLGAALQARDADLPVLYLGTEMPAAEIARVAARLGAAGVAISSVDPGQARRALEELGALDREMAPGLPVWLGGANARYLAEACASPRISAVGEVRAMPTRPKSRRRRTAAVASA